MLLYSLLYLAGVKKVDPSGRTLDEPAISLDDIRNFRQLGRVCAGHPEYGEAAGIETTTGPLGQGAGTSVGMAMAARWLAARYNRPNFDLFGYRVFALCSDGDVMEGIGCEAASLAGHLQLSNLCWIYDDNRITIEGDPALAFSEDVVRRFEGLGWHTIRVEDANDLEALNGAFDSFQQTDDRPTLIAMRSVIGYGSPNKAGSHAAHGAPLGEEEVQRTKEAYGWPPEECFRVPDGVLEHFEEGLGTRGRTQCQQWHSQFQEYSQAHPEAAVQLKKIWSRELPDGWDRDIPSFEPDEKGLATRASSGKVLNAVAASIPWMLGGSADLAPSNNTMLKFDGTGHLGPQDPAGRNLHFGVREHAMAAASNGLSLTGLRAYCGTFFVFTD